MKTLRLFCLTTLLTMFLAGSVSAGQGKLTLTWVNNATNAASIRIDRAPAPGTAFTTLTSGLAPTLTTFVDAGLPDSTTFCYKVVAVNAGGEGASAAVCGTTNAILPPVAISNLTVQ